MIICEPFSAADRAVPLYELRLRGHVAQILLHLRCHLRWHSRANVAIAVLRTQVDHFDGMYGDEQVYPV